MINHLKGIIETKKENYIIIDINGIGYKVFMPENSIQNLDLEEKVKIYTYLRVSEDEINLYGFLSFEELTMFELLISVGGIGSKSAIKILSNIAPSKFALAVISNDVGSLKKLPGIGVKTAQRIILELKDKIKKEQQIQELTESTKEIKTKVEVAIESSKKIEEAIAALQVLGYNKKEIEKAFEKIDKKEQSTEDLIRKGLAILGK